jgi:hypothetical protein
MRKFLLVIYLAVSSIPLASGIIIRDDRPDAKYLALGGEEGYTRVSSYIGWIKDTLSGKSKPLHVNQN